MRKLFIIKTRKKCHTPYCSLDRDFLVNMGHFCATCQQILGFFLKTQLYLKRTLGLEQKRKEFAKNSSTYTAILR